MDGDGAPAREWVESERLDRFIQTVGCASVGAIDEAVAMAGAVQEDRFGVVEQSMAIFLSELRRAREERAAAMSALEASRTDLEQKLAIIERQQADIRKLSAPIIEVWDRIVSLPLIGIADSAHLQEVTARLLQRISDRGDQCVIVDLTGIESAGAQTASHVVKLVRCAALLGAFCVLTGLRSELAASLVRAGVDLGCVPTLRTLKEGIRVCLAHLASEP